jgi:hypothetical protein
MAVEIPEQMVVVLRSGRVPLPFLDVELKQSFIVILLCGMKYLT